MDTNDKRFRNSSTINNDLASLQKFREIIPIINKFEKNSSYKELLADMMDILSFDSLSISIFSDEKSEIEDEFVSAKYEYIKPKVNAFQYLNFIREEKRSIHIKGDEALNSTEIDDIATNMNIVIVPVHYEDDIIALMVASRLHSDIDNSTAELLELSATQLGWAYHNIRVQHSLMVANQKLSKTRDELESIVRDEVVKILDSEKKIQEIEAQLIQSEKFSTMGKLIAGVAHEIKNPMTAIKGYVALISRIFCKVEELGSSNELINGLVMAVDHLETIITSYLSFAKKGNGMQNEIHINDVLLKTEVLVKHSLDIAGVRLFMNVDNDIPTIRGDINQLIQVFMNLIINAQQAIVDSKGGKIDVNTFCKEDYVVVEVVDNGVGIKEENINQIFDNFFTTKGLEKSSGIGLSISKGIIDNHGGTIDVISKELLGTKFTLTFPVAI